MAYVATLQKTWVSGAASLVPTWVDPATAITLVADFDSANASESTSTIDNATTSTPSVNVNFRSLGDGWRHALFAVENAAGKSPVFKLNRSQRRNTTAVPDSAWRPAYTLDFETWVHAESFSLTASTIEFEFADPLPSGRVYVASNPILQESWSATFASWLLTSRSSVASPATSSNAAGVFHTSPTETDDLGRSVGGRSMYGIKLRFGGATNDGQPKRKLVVFAGVHAAGEADSNLAFKYFTEYLIDSTDTEAVALRANWDVDLYFNLTPNGYFGGHPRTNFRSSADPNRSWDVPYDELSATQTAVLAEIDGGRFDACLSWHGWASATTNFRGYLTPLDNDPETRSPAVTEMLSAGATIFGGSGTFTTSGTNNTDIWWGQSQGAALSVNPEVPNFGDVTLANYQSIGENWAKVLRAVDEAGVFIPPISGSADLQETGSDDFTASGSVLVSGSLAGSETGSDAFSATGQVVVTGSLAATETGADTFAGTATLTFTTVTGSLAAQEAGSDTLAASGTVAISGVFEAVEEGSDTFSATGGSAFVEIEGTLAVQEAGVDTFVASGAVVITGSLAAQEEGVDIFAAASSEKRFNIRSINGVNFLV